MKKLVVYLVLAAFLHNCIGCTVRRTGPAPKENIPETSQIVEAILPSGEMVSFDPPGAVILPDEGAIVGTTIRGRSTAVRMSDIVELRRAVPDTLPRSLIGMREISEIIIGDVRVEFKYNQYEYNKPGRLLRGDVISRNGLFNNRKTIRLNEIQSIRAGKPDIVKVPELLSDPKPAIAEIVTVDDRVITFDNAGGSLATAPAILRGNVTGRQYEIDLDDVLYVNISRVDPAMSFFAFMGGLALVIGTVIAIIAATKESCPFVYSFDGERYVFDAEPLGGAITRGLSKTDYSLLEHLKPVQGKYYLTMRNEVEEIQFIDETKLVLVDHQEEVEVTPDLMGNLIEIREPALPTSAVDENGQNLMEFFKKQDGVVWQSQLPVNDQFLQEPLRHQLTFKFPKPKEANKAKLIVNAGTALWGSNMIREMLQLRGNQVDAWYEAIDNGGAELKELHDFIGREELYALKLYLKNGNEWLQQGIVPGGGPLITENRVIHLDLKDLMEEELTIRVHPPKGFWTLNYLAVDYTETKLVESTSEIPLSEAVDQNNSRVAAKMLNKDSDYHVMKEVGDWVRLVFEVPRQPQNTRRSIFLKSHGYYKIQFDKTLPEQTGLIKELLKTPGKIVEYSLVEYLKWRNGSISLN